MRSDPWRQCHFLGSWNWFEILWPNNLMQCVFHFSTQQLGAREPYPLLKTRWPVILNCQAMKARNRRNYFWGLNIHSRPMTSMTSCLHPLGCGVKLQTFNIPWVGSGDTEGPLHTVIWRWSAVYMTRLMAETQGGWRIWRKISFKKSEGNIIIIFKCSDISGHRHYSSKLTVSCIIW